MSLAVLEPESDASAVALPAAPVRPLRRVPAPATEPEAVPFTDFTTPTRTGASVQEALGCDLPARPVGRRLPTLRVVGEDRVPERPLRPLPEPRAWVARLVMAVLEVEAGTRPPVQLARYLEDRLFAQVRRRALRERRAPGTRLRSVRVCEPAAGVAEATVVLERTGRCTALVVRIEAVQHRWVCTVLEPLLPGAAVNAGEPKVG
jgi:hypothetical protein